MFWGGFCPAQSHTVQWCPVYRRFWSSNQGGTPRGKADHRYDCAGGERGRQTFTNIHHIHHAQQPRAVWLLPRRRGRSLDGVACPYICTSHAFMHVEKGAPTPTV